MVNDRATLFNLLIGLNGYTISTGVISEELNGKDIYLCPWMWLNNTGRNDYS